MYYYKEMYLDQALEKKKEKVIRKLESGKIQIGVSLIVLAQGEHNQLEIIDTLLFAQPSYPKRDLYVVGMAKGYDQAVELVETMVSDVYQETGNVDLKAYFQKKERAGETCYISFC